MLVAVEAHKIVYLAVCLLNKMYVGWVIVATGPELCQKGDFFPEKEDERNFAYGGFTTVVSAFAIFHDFLLSAALLFIKIFFQ